MAIIKCPECRKDVSDKATICLHCGYPVAPKKFNGSTIWIILVTIGLLVFGFILGWINSR